MNISILAAIFNAVTGFILLQTYPTFPAIQFLSFHPIFSDKIFYNILIWPKFESPFRPPIRLPFRPLVPRPISSDLEYFFSCPHLP